MFYQVQRFHKPEIKSSRKKTCSLKESTKIVFQHPEGRILRFLMLRIRKSKAKETSPKSQGLSGKCKISGYFWFQIVYFLEGISPKSNLKD